MTHLLKNLKMTKNEAESLEGNIKYSELAEALKNMKTQKLQEMMGSWLNFLNSFGLTSKTLFLTH